MATASRCSVIREDVNDKTGEAPYTGGLARSSCCVASLVTDVQESDQPPRGCLRRDN